MKQNLTQETQLETSPKSFTTAISMPMWLKVELDRRRMSAGLTRNDMMVQIIMGKYPAIHDVPVQDTVNES